MSIQRMNLTVQPVTGHAGARPAPGEPQVMHTLEPDSYRAKRNVIRCRTKAWNQSMAPGNGAGAMNRGMKQRHRTQDDRTGGKGLTPFSSICTMYV